MKRIYTKNFGKRFGTIVLILIGLFFISQFASAQTSSLDLGLEPVGQNIGLGNDDIRVTIARIIRVALGLLGIIAIGLVLYGGFTWMTAGGNDEKVGQAKKIIINGVIGLAIILSSYAITTFIINKLVEATGESGLGNSGGENPPPDPFITTSQFYVSSLPPAIQMCVRNVNLAIVFNKPIDLSSIQGNVVVQDKSDNNSEVGGSWKFGASENIIIFTPEGSCSPSIGNDCLKVSSDYSLVFKNSANVRSSENADLRLNCLMKAGCGPVNFTSGSAVDRLPPTISIISPENNSSYSPNNNVPVRITYNDDNGIQNLSLFVKNSENKTVLAGSLASAQCKKTDTVTINWNTVGYKSGEYTLNGIGTDFAGLSGQDSINTTIRPNHCYNGILDNDLGEEQLGPPECGGECGSCSGGSCTNDTQCASGSCINGYCQNVMKITSFSPASGAVGTYVSIYGQFFGTNAGKVYFANKNQPNPDEPADWMEADIPACSGSILWSNNQIIVQVPKGTASSTSIKVEAVNGGAPVRDTTTNRGLDNFIVNSLVRPGICGLVPNSGQAGDSVVVNGKNFGILASAGDSVFFGEQKANILKNSNGTLAWSDEVIGAAVPGINSGNVGVKIVKNNVESNSVKFTVFPGASNSYPLIESVTPGNGSRGEYITIIGKNFGNAIGSVWFKTSVSSQAISGSFSFPSDCKNVVWSDRKITVKFPPELGTPGVTYYVQVNTADNKTSLFDSSQAFALETGSPRPGICAISPASGPIPLPEGQSTDVYGEYFNSGVSNVYFWNKNATDPVSITGRTAAALNSGTNTNLDVLPANDTITGPVSVFRSNDSEISNPVNFSAVDCTTTGNSCGAGYHCCLGGNQKGVCLIEGQNCSGELRSAGYVWRFSTKDIPPVPKVVERCNAVSESGQALPSPSPSIQWDGVSGDSYGVCKTALVTIEFNSVLNQSSINANTVKINRCDSVSENKCNNPTPVALDQTSYVLNIASNSDGEREYLSIKSSGDWQANAWYQVVLSTGIKSADQEMPLALSADKPCGEGTAYCFYFKGGGDDCKLRSVIVTPYSYRTNMLEAPLSRMVGQVSVPVFYKAGGLSSEKCILMDVNNLNWSWKSQNSFYADIFGSTNAVQTTVESKANTVGIGLPGNTVGIEATGAAQAGVNVVSKSGVSPLTIDLSKPEVADWWPKCQEACTNAEVAVKFNVSLSMMNLYNAVENGVVKLYQCLDENCIDVIQVGDSASVQLDPIAPYATLRIANSNPESESLQPNTYYKVAVSSSSTNPFASSQVIWSRSIIDDPDSVGKPYNQEFSWKFKTKSSACTASKVKVNPSEYVAREITDRAVYNAESYSSPDSCNANGQKLNSWTTSWNWSSSSSSVATVSSFSTEGKNPYCTAKCLKSGSTIALGKNIINGICGNEKLEAGEDCDEPSRSAGCGLNCRFLGTTEPTCGNGVIDAGEGCDINDDRSKIGCSASCRRTGSLPSTDDTNTSGSVCGNGMVGSGEDCDLGIASNINSSTSALSCTSKCLHTGTKISSSWCLENRTGFGGFTEAEYNRACANAVSICGDGITGPDEDEGCDLGNGEKSSWCNSICLNNSTESAECSPGSEGCGDDGQNNGSSLMYNEPSVCGDGVVGLGEDDFCEQNRVITHSGLFDPWALAIGQGRGEVSGIPPRQSANIIASAEVSGNPTGNGKFSIYCGFKDDNDCAFLGSDFGVGSDSCCYAKPLPMDFYPVDGSSNTCLNTAIEVSFNGKINPATLTGNLLIAKGSTAATCSGSDQNVTSLMAVQESNSTWYKNIYRYFKKILVRIFSVSAALEEPTIWCAGSTLGKPNVINNPDGTTKVSLSFSNPLAPETHYAVILKDGIKDKNGVSIGKIGEQYYSWRFSTGFEVCQISSVGVTPDEWYFSGAGESTVLRAEAYSRNNKIQPIPNIYDWVYEWQPTDSPIISVQDVPDADNLITSKNRNGEVDVRAFANVTQNIMTATTGTVANGSSHIVVFLCENPWPPKEVEVNGGAVKVFPYGDNIDNSDSFDLIENVFNGGSINPSYSGVGDGYYNFSTYYCADNGGTGTFDDWPYLRAAVQTTERDLKLDRGACEFTGDTCVVDNDCGILYTNQIDFVAPVGSNVCGAVVSSTNKYYLNSSGDPIACTSAAGCTNPDYQNWLSANNASAACISPSSLPKRNLNCFIYSPLKRFIFTNSLNGDAIGIQIFPNKRHLTPSQWYSSNRASGGQGFKGQVQAITVDGYNAVSDGNNIYVGGLNYSSGDGTINDVIYLFSINENASSETRHVFDEMMKNLQFNTNLEYNDGYCGASIYNPGTEIKCTSDLDCGNGEVCSNQIAKLQRNYERLSTLKTFDISAQSYRMAKGAYPSVADGSFLPGQSISSWPSWGTLGNTLSYSIPKDPVNKLGIAGSCKSNQSTYCLSNENCPAGDTCVLHDSQTGWSTADQRFSYACSPSSYAYRFIESPSLGYMVKSKFEDPGITISNLSNFLNSYGFSDLNRFPGVNAWTEAGNPNGICNTATEISTANQGTCGDGKVNVSDEDCDPAGTKIYDRSGCTSSGGSAGVKVCSTNCKWETESPVSCKSLAKCGDGKVEYGEKCDDGALLNGTLNHCNTTCTSKTFATPSTCTYTYNSWGPCISSMQYRTVSTSIPAGCTGNPELEQSCVKCNYTYSAWGACDNSASKQTRTITGVSPAGCSDQPDPLEQDCVPPPPSCSYNYGDWSDCVNGVRTRAVLSSAPEGCVGTPVTSEGCSAPICSYQYSPWGTCMNNSQTRTVISSSPADCVGTPVLDQTCVSPPCTYSYTPWGTCSLSGNQTRTVVTSSPPGCVGTPAINQSCTPNCQYTYSAWGSCDSSSATQSRTVISKQPAAPADCNGDPILTQSCTPNCTYSYSNWNPCVNGSQTRTIVSKTPAECIETPAPTTTQSCVMCTSFEYSGWGACINSTQTRTVISSSPAGCSGGSPTTTQSCTMACESFNYSDWGSCQPSNTQTRTVISSNPAVCSGGASPVLSQACTYQQISLSNVNGKFFGTGPTNYGLAFFPVNGTTPRLSKNFRNIAFNVASGLGYPTFGGVYERTYPFTNVIVDSASNPVGTESAEGSGPSSYYWVRSSDSSFNAVYSGYFRVNVGGTYNLMISSNDGFILGVGNSVEGSTPTRTSGSVVRANTYFYNFPTMHSSMVQSSGNTPRYYSINFPAAGAYPFELDFIEDGVFGSTISMFFQDANSGAYKYIPPAEGLPVLTDPALPPVCTQFTYGPWGSCNSDGFKFRSVLSRGPAGCTGGFPDNEDICPGCFAEGTKVLTPTGYSRIEDLEIGDTVISYDESTKSNVVSSITLTREFERDHYYLINDSLQVTQEHKIAVKSADGIHWTEVRDLQSGDVFIDSKGNEVVAATIERFEVPSLKVYNPAMNWPNNYFVELNGKYILVHNLKDDGGF